MSDFIASTPELGRRWCPGCEPDADQRQILTTEWCSLHWKAAQPDGADDEAVDRSRWLSGSAESEGETNRAFAEFLRGRK